ncbi:MAG: molybdopterin-dependent oxidoreductase [Epsilonproteobacteria bacterium]|nr:molybdopterin-dependent oxidoreductase [Campylobacterota bacterium]
MFCPLDCWDACKLKVKNEKCKVNVCFEGEGITPYLCWKLNNYFKFPRETSAKYNGKNIMLSNGLEKLSDILKNTEPKRVLFVKGSGNMGIMQNVTKLFFEKYGATFAVGSTCDGVGEEGIKRGRGKSLILPTWIIKNAKNVLLWGRNAAVTNIHLLELIKDKKVKVIDVLNSKTAKMFEYIQVNPNSDYFLAILLAREVIGKNLIKRDDGVGFAEFKELVFSYNKNELLNRVGISEKTLSELTEFIKGGAAILTGLGVAKCKECYKTTWAIDSLFFMLDYFGKSDKGVAFLGSSGYGLNNPFNVNPKNKIPLFDVNLDEFDVVFIQAANPLVSFVNKNEWEKLKEKITVVFGKYMDESAKAATLFIPTKDFFEKKDVRGSYFHEYVLVQKSVKPFSGGVSEYELTKYLMREFGFGGLKSEEDYIDFILNAELERIDDGVYRKKVFDKPPYSDGFFTEDKKFHFLTEKFEYKEKEFEVVTAKGLKALNSQFLRDDNIYINPKSKNIMLSWVEEKFDKSLIKFNENLPKNIVFAKGGATINKILKAKGENAYYEI